MSAIEAISPGDFSTELQLPPSVHEVLVARAKNLKMLPAIAMQALEIAKDPECGIAEFAAVVERDVTLAADILRMANSIVFARGRTVMNLNRAVVRVGIRTCKSLIIASSFNSMMRNVSLDEEWIREILGRHAFTTALLCMHLNRSLNVGFLGEEFAAGLIHDIGRTVLATCFPSQFSEIDRLTFDEGSQTTEDERRVILTDHCETGAWFARRNSLPEPLVDVVAWHHAADQAPRSRRLVALVAACDHMANYLQRAEDSAGYDPSANSAIKVLEKCGLPYASSCFPEIAATVMDSARADALEMMDL